MLQRKLVEFELSQQLLAESQDADYPGTPPRPLIVNKSREALDKGLQNGQNAVSPK
ncbi:rCG53205 [Rattus norvegicus]|nr:rCG53205 [Rattus norvegicus]